MDIKLSKPRSTTTRPPKSSFRLFCFLARSSSSSSSSPAARFSAFTRFFSFFASFSRARRSNFIAAYRCSLAALFAAFLERAGASVVAGSVGGVGAGDWSTGTADDDAATGDGAGLSLIALVALHEGAKDLFTTRDRGTKEEVREKGLIKELAGT